MNNDKLKKNLSVVIPAAGAGRRLGLKIPKCMVEVGGESIIHRQIKMCHGQDVLVVIGYRGEEVAEHVKEIRKDVTFVENLDYGITGTAHSVLLAAPMCREDIVVLDGDLLITEESLQQFFLSRVTSLLGYTHRRTATSVGVRIEDELLTEFGYELSSKMEWSGPFRIPKSVALQFGSMHSFESLKRYLPLPGAFVNCYEIDDEADLLGAPSWLMANGLVK